MQVPGTSNSLSVLLFLWRSNLHFCVLTVLNTQDIWLESKNLQKWVKHFIFEDAVVLMEGSCEVFPSGEMGHQGGTKPGQSHADPACRLG